MEICKPFEGKLLYLFALVLTMQNTCQQNIIPQNCFAHELH